MLKQIEAAEESWKAAPMHVKTLASAYMSPILAALRAAGQEIESLNMRLESAEGAMQRALGHLKVITGGVKGE